MKAIAVAIILTMSLSAIGSVSAQGYKDPDAVTTPGSKGSAKNSPKGQPPEKIEDLTDPRKKILITSFPQSAPVRKACTRHESVSDANKAHISLIGSACELAEEWRYATVEITPDMVGDAVAVVRVTSAWANTILDGAKKANGFAGIRFGGTAVFHHDLRWCWITASSAPSNVDSTSGVHTLGGLPRDFECEIGKLKAGSLQIGLLATAYIKDPAPSPAHSAIANASVGADKLTIYITPPPPFKPGKLQGETVKRPEGSSASGHKLGSLTDDTELYRPATKSPMAEADTEMPCLDPVIEKPYEKQNFTKGPIVVKLKGPAKAAPSKFVSKQMVRVYVNRYDSKKDQVFYLDMPIDGTEDITSRMGAKLGGTFEPGSSATYRISAFTHVDASSSCKPRADRIFSITAPRANRPIAEPDTNQRDERRPNPTSPPPVERAPAERMRQSR